MNMKDSNISIGIKLAEKLSDPNLDSNFTVDDFFIECGIPEEQRTDFAFAAAAEQACARLGIKNMNELEVVKNA